MKPGDLMRIKHAGDQTPWVRRLVGQHCVLIENLTESDGVISSTNIWRVLICGSLVDVHTLDLEPIDETR
jgi:hypothetical protein